MGEDGSPQLLLSRQFASFEELAAAVVAWDFDFHQLSKNYFETSLEQVRAGDILFSHLACGCYSTHAGGTPGGMYTLGLPDEGCTDFRYFDQRVEPPALLLRAPGQEFDIVARPGYGLSTFSIVQPVFEAWCEARLDRPLKKLLSGGDGVVPISVADATILRAMALELRRSAQRVGGSSGLPDSMRSFETRLLESVVGSLGRSRRAGRRTGAASRSQAFRRARSFIGDHRGERLSVGNLAAALNTSERTLERAFNRESGMSPKRYLFGKRMYGAHRQLWQSDAAHSSVADVANAWGFWHMGQFARDYRRLFGELPSTTLKRPAAPRLN